MKFSDFDFNESIKKNLDKKGYDEATPVQEKTIPLLLNGQDLIACAKTGSGKTLAFVLPMLNLLAAENKNLQPKEARALILAPTRELAIQIFEEANYFAQDLQVRLVNVYGGQDYEKQKRKVQNGVDLLIATPGRLQDFYRSKDLFLEEVNYVVLDEADRMLDMGFIDDVKYILGQMKNIKNISLWSATVDYNVFYSIWNHMNDPEEVLINPEWVDRSKISQYLLHLGSSEKLAYTLEYCRRLQDESLIIFTNTREMVNILTNALSQYGVAAQGLSAIINQKKRVSILEGFKRKDFKVLVATDLASRGIPCVINYDIPQDPESYVHRIGRTARAGKEGMSLSICCERDYDSLEKVESYLGDKIPIMEPAQDIMSELSSIQRKIRITRGYRSEAPLRRERNTRKKTAGSQMKTKRPPQKRNFAKKNTSAPPNFSSKPHRPSPEKYEKRTIDFDDYPATHAAPGHQGKTSLVSKLKGVFTRA